MRLPLPLLLAFTSLLMLAGCERSLDADQDALCRRLIPALYDTSEGVTITAGEPAPANGTYVKFKLGKREQEMLLYCQFAGSGLSLRKREMTSIRLNGRTLGPSQFYFLKERWLETQDAIAVEPKPLPRAGPPPADLPFALAYALQHALAALPRIGILCLLATSYALIFGLVGQINLAFGAFAALGGVIAVLIITVLDIAGFPSLPYGVFFGVSMAVSIAALWGSVVAKLVIVPMAARSGQPILVASTGLMLAMEEFLRVTQGSGTRWLSPVYNTPLSLARSGNFVVTVTPMAIMTTFLALIGALAIAMLMRRSRFGLAWRAVSDDPVAASLFGVSPAALLGLTFALACGLAGFAGVLVALFYGGMGFAGGGSLGLMALFAAILGGIGSIGGAFIGALVVGALETLWSATMPIDYRESMLLVLMALFLALKPNGLTQGREPISLRV